MKQTIKTLLQKVGLLDAARCIYKALVPERRWPSETSKCRPRLVKYCVGSGIDIGPGGDPITPAAVRVDLAAPYSSVGNFPVQLAGNAADLFWFADAVLDYVYSSHVLEDFEDTERVLSEWLRVLKPGGRLILYCPDENVYRKHCESTGQPYNSHHKHKDFSLKYVSNILNKQGGIQYLHACKLIDVYSWELVVQKMSS